MSETAPPRAVQTYRERLASRGIVRFELKATKTDRDLLRDLAKRLVDGPKADDLRRSLQDSLNREQERRGGVLATFLDSPFAASDLDLSHPYDAGRAIDL